MVMDFSYLDELLAEEAEPGAALEEQPAGYRNLWVLAELAQGLPTRPTLETLAAGRDLADQLGVYLVALVLTDQLDQEAAEALIRHGADQVRVLAGPHLVPYQPETYVQVLAEQVDQQRPEILLLPATPLGNDLAPRLAQHLNTGLMAGCVGLALDMAERLLLGTMPALGGRLRHTYACPDARPQIATLMPGSFSAAKEDPSRQGSVQQVSLAPAESKDRLRWIEHDLDREVEPVGLPGARIIVAIGRGIGNSRGLELAQRLAVTLDGQLAGSRGAVEAGWIDASRQVGLSGHTVRPDLYIACGISGAIQHCFGVPDYGYLVAINRDEGAPIMSMANVGAIGDAQEILEALLQALEDGR